MLLRLEFLVVLCPGVPGEPGAIGEVASGSMTMKALSANSSAVISVVSWSFPISPSGRVIEA
jgi:hypothetical protein